MKMLIFSLSLLFFFCCSKNQEYNDLDEGDSVFFGLNDTIYLKTEFSECGEWGGSQEFMKIYSNENHSFLDYKKTKADCNKIDKKRGYPLQNKEFDKIFKLNDKEKKSILRYIQRLIKSKSNEKLMANFGNFFSVTNSDSTLLIKVFDNNEYNIESYNMLLKDLGITSKKRD